EDARRHVQGVPSQTHFLPNRLRPNKLITGEGIQSGAGQQVIKQDELHLISNTSYPELKLSPMGLFNTEGHCLNGHAMFHLGVDKLGEPEQYLSHC
uniref:Uncharacterized protein n=1 Tax=Prolemur simus TaxID=1328070 RepID=A0A8C9DG23_PROSS